MIRYHDYNVITVFIYFFMFFIPIINLLTQVKSTYPQFVNLKATYIIPTGDGLVTLGGTHQYDNWDAELSVLDSQGIWDRCISVVPEIASAATAWEWVGLRPFRETVRVETESKVPVGVMQMF